MTYPIVIKDELLGFVFTLPNPNSGKKTTIHAIPGHEYGHMSTNICRANFGRDCYKKVESMLQKEEAKRKAEEEKKKHKPIETWTASDAVNLLNPSVKSSALLYVAFAHTTE